MTKREAIRQTEQERALMSLGFTREEANQLRRISMTLRRWYELECGVANGGVERDETTGKTFWYWSRTGKRTPYPDRETGAKRRLRAIVDARNARRNGECAACSNGSGTGDVRDYGQGQHVHVPDVLRVYLQTDPRGAALYLLRPGDVPNGEDVQAYYARGICVY